MGPSVKPVNSPNAATPLSLDFLKILQGQLDEGAFGTGVGPLQRESGTAARQYVNDLQQKTKTGYDTAGKVKNTSDQLITAFTNKSKSNERQSAGDLREAFGIAGSRYGTALATGEGKLRAESNLNLDQNIASILTDQGAREQSAREFDIGANQADFTQLLQAIGMLFSQGQANTDVFSQFGQRGITDTEDIVTPSVGSQALTGVLSLAGNYLAGGGKVPGLGGKDKKTALTSGTPVNRGAVVGDYNGPANGYNPFRFYPG